MEMGMKLLKICNRGSQILDVKEYLCEQCLLSYKFVVVVVI